jgi:hypothetical protein
MEDANKPSVTPFSITDILNRQDIQGINNNSSSLWERRGLDHHQLPTYLPSSPYLHSFQPFAPCTNYPCPTQRIASSPKDTTHSEESNAEESTDRCELSKDHSEYTFDHTLNRGLAFRGLDSLSAKVPRNRPPSN